MTARTSLRTLWLAAALAAAGPLCLPPARARAEGPAGADVLVMKDGRRLEGAIVADSPDGVTFRSAGSTRFYDKDQIERTERGAAPAAPETPVPAGDAASGGSAAPASAPPAAKAPDKQKRPKALTDESRAWVRELAGKAVTGDETVRRSIAAGLRACGPAAVPTIREAAAAQADPAARAFLDGIAQEMLGGKGDRMPKGGAAAPGAPATGATDPATGMAPSENPDENGGPPKRPEPGRGGRGAMLEKISQELELRDDQKQPFMAVLAGMDRARGQAMKEVENGGTIDAGRTKLAEVRAKTIEGAKAVLDAGQMEAFELMAERFFGDMEMRLQKAASRKGAGGPAPAAPEAPAAPPADEPKPQE